MIMQHIVVAMPLENYLLGIKFRAGSVRILDMKPYIEKGEVFGRLRNQTVFRQVQVEEDLGGLVWPNSADFCPDTAFMQSKPYRPRETSQGVGITSQALS